MLASKTLQAVDRYIYANQESSFRRHLGASLIGQECQRRLWYSFRWAKEIRHEARLLRLFDRGKLEEERFTKYLRDIGVTVWTHSDNGEQFHVGACDGHFGGSLDGVAKGLPELDAEEPALLEFKTHKDKSFTQLKAEGVVGAKYQHYIQMQVYMYLMKLSIALYCAVNKDTDELYLEYVKLNEAVAKQTLDKADKIIHCEEEPPPRISQTPGWWACKTCDFRNLCHFYELPAINCRTCAHSTPGPNKTWLCTRDKKEIETQLGCEEHIFLPALLNGVQIVGGNEEENYFELRLPNGKSIRQGPQYTSSQNLQNVLSSL